MSAIAIALLGMVVIVIIALVVGIVDVVQAPRWRRVAAERHEEWEARRLQHHGPPGIESWDG